MSRLIDTRELYNVVTKRKDEYGRLAVEVDNIVKEMVRETPTVQAIRLDKIKQVMEQIIDEKDFAYADFNEYKREVLGVEDADDLPDDDFRFGMGRCLDILNKLIAESEGK